MLDNPRTHFGHRVSDSDDFDVGVSDDGSRYIVEHLPSGETTEIGPGGFDTNSVHTKELYSNSIPTRVRLWKDDSGTAYAATDDTLIDSGTSHGSVIQSAIDWVVANLAESPSNLNTRHIKGWINGGGETYTTSQTIRQKEEAGLCNMDLDANGASLPDGVIRIEPSQGQVDNLGDVYIHNAATRFIRVQNNGGGPGVVSQDQGRGSLTRVIASNNSGDGIVIAGGITVTGYSLYSHSNDGDGIVITDTSNSHGNLNQLFSPASARNGGHGLHIYKDTQPSDDTDLNRIVGGDVERNTVGVMLGDGARTTTVMDTWIEGNSTAIRIDGPNRSAGWNRIIRCGAGEIEVGKAYNTSLIENAEPVQYNTDITIESGAVDTYLKNNRLGSGTVTDNGTRTYRDHYGNTNETRLRYHNTGGQSIASSTSSSTTVDFTTLNYDERGEFDMASDTFTADFDGKYAVDVAVLWPASTPADAECRAEIFKNGTVRASDFQTADGSTVFTTSASDLIGCSAGDTMSARVRQDSGGSVSITGGTSNTYLTIRRM